ncbi:uncharacterized protein LOC124404215 [Diprion similis]|uniref:uncharacterized protein LOC124404215 n=1 Tax=Diprion similis TaxID=362088 RepID=UPI001EF7878B|nr:uncharacterized protein LOC124404215 [Diprion similis]
MEKFATALCILLTVYGVQARMTLLEASTIATGMALLEKRGYNFMNSSVHVKTKIKNITSYAETLGNSTLSSMNSTLYSDIDTISDEMDALSNSSCVTSLTTATATAKEIVANATTCWNALIPKLDAANTTLVTTITNYIGDWEDVMLYLYTNYTADVTSDMDSIFDIQDLLDDLTTQWYEVANAANETLGNYLDFLFGVASCNQAAEIATFSANLTLIYAEAVNCSSTSTS